MKSAYNDQHGIFISYKRSYRHLAGRIYDYFKNKGLDPFIDDYSMKSEPNYREKIIQEIKQTPYFLFLLTKDGLKDLLSPDYIDKDYYIEIQTAVESDRKILVLRDQDIQYDEIDRVPEAIREKMRMINSEPINMNDIKNFFSIMERLMSNLDLTLLRGIVNWREYINLNANILLQRRQELERTVASYENRFGKEFIDCIKNNQPYDGTYRVKEINMACYAANMIFTNNPDMLDRLAFDNGMIFKVFNYLLRDPSFHLRMILTAPFSQAAKDAVRYRRLGNSAFEDHPEGVFLSSYANICHLLETDPFDSAEKRRHFSVTYTECNLPYSIFEVVYKDGWERFNHIKIDLYSLNLDTSVERPSFIIFEKDNKVCYDYFRHQFSYLRRDEFRSRSQQLQKKNGEKWLSDWDALQMEMQMEMGAKK